MASLLGTLFEILRILCSSAKDHIKRIPRSCWAPLLAYLSRKLSEWWCSWLSKPGTRRNPKPADPSFPGGRGGSCPVSCSSARRASAIGHAARVAACTVPASANAANRSSREDAEWQPETQAESPIPATLPVDPPWVSSPDLNLRSHWVDERNPTNHSTGNLSLQSASDRQSIDRHSITSISHTSSRASATASAQNDRPSGDPRATYRQFGSRPRSKGRSSRSPSPQPSLNTVQPDNLDIAPASAPTYAHANGVMNATIGFQGLTDFPPSSSHTRERPRRRAFRRPKQRTTSIGLNFQNPSTESLPQEITEELMTVETSTRSPSRISLACRSETASQHAYTASSASLNCFMLPEGRIVQLINSDQIPRYTKNVATQVDYFFIVTQSSHMLADLTRENCALWNP